LIADFRPLLAGVSVSSGSGIDFARPRFTVDDGNESDDEAVAAVERVNVEDFAVVSFFTAVALPLDDGFGVLFLDFSVEGVSMAETERFGRLRTRGVDSTSISSFRFVCLIVDVFLADTFFSFVLDSSVGEDAERLNAGFVRDDADFFAVASRFFGRFVSSIVLELL